MPPQPKAKYSNVLPKKQIQNMERGIGCVNCGKPATRKYHKYKICNSKGCLRTVKVIWASNCFARRVGNS